MLKYVIHKINKTIGVVNVSVFLGFFSLCINIL